MMLVLVLAVTACGDVPEPDPAPPAEGAPGMPAEAVPDPDDGAAAEPDGAPGEGADPDPGEGTAAEPGEETVRVWFSRGEAPAAVERRVEDADPEAALRALLRGPTAAERAAGLNSWFSDSTAGALRGVEARDGLLVVDFDGLDRLIPNASSSAGSAQLLGSLNPTVFQFPSVDSVEYRLGGSCEAFWEWLQRECGRLARP